MLKNYLKIAWKVLTRKKLYTGVILFNMVLTLTILNVILAFTNHFWGYNAEQKNFDKVLAIQDMNLTKENDSYNFRSSLSYTFIEKYIKSMETPVKVGAVTMPFAAEKIYYYTKGKRHKLKLKYCDSEYWDILNFSFVEGKPFKKDDIDANDFIAVIDAQTRDVNFSDGKCVGKYIKIRNIPFKIVGVVENVDFLKQSAHANIWVPYTHAKFQETNYFGGAFEALLLAKDPNDFDKIKTELANVVAKIDFPNPDAFNQIEISAEPYFFDLLKQVVGEGGNVESILSNISIIFLIIYFLLPVINLINVNTNRIFERASEIGVRKSFGATISTVTIQFIIENIFVTLFALLLSVCLSFVVLAAFNASGFIPNAIFKLELPVIYKSLVWSLLLGMFSSVFPAYRLSKVNIVKSLNIE